MTAILATLFSAIITILDFQNTTTDFWFPFEEAPILWIPIFLLVLIVAFYSLTIMQERIIELFRTIRNLRNSSDNDDE